MHSSDCLKIQLSLSNNFLLITIIAFNSMLTIIKVYSIWRPPCASETSVPL